MRARATCRHCGREFLLSQLYNAEPGAADRCPHCSLHLGVPGVRSLALRIDRAAADLVWCLSELAARSPQLTVDRDSILGPVGEALRELAFASLETPRRDGQRRPTTA